MKLLRGMFVVFMVLVIGGIGVGLFLPDRAHVERSIVIEAPPSAVFVVLAGFKQFNRWSPWADLDPQTVYTYSGPPWGKGARQQWHSNDPKVGGGSQEVIDLRPYAELRLRLSFDGMDTDNEVIYALTPEGAGTRVTWSIDTTFGGNLLNRYFGLLFDRMIGPDFEKGLARLKPLVESLPRDDFSAMAIEIRQVAAQPLATLAAEARYSEAAPVIGASFAKIGAFLSASGRKPAGAPITVTHAFDEQTQAWSFDAALPIDAPCTPVAEEGGVQCRSGYAGWALWLRHQGPYATIPAQYARVRAFKTVAGLESAADSWEQYVNDPGVTAEAELATDLYSPVQ